MSAKSSARFFTPLSMFLREYYRNTLNLVLLVVIPIILIQSFGSSLSRLANLFSGVSLTLNMGKALGALWSAAFLSGLMGFFMMNGAREADRRLVRAGYHPMQVVGFRVLTVALLGLIATLVSYGVLIAQFTPENLILTFVALYAGAVIYSAVGILIGALIPGELEGSFAMLFFFVMDAFIGSPLFGTTSDVFILLPTHYPMIILKAMTAQQAHDPIHWLYTAIYGIVVILMASYTFYRIARLR